MEPRHRAAGCDGKKVFETWTLAHVVAVRANRYGRGERTSQAYHCRYCSHFHIGSSGATRQRLNNFKARRAAAASEAE